MRKYFAMSCIFFALSVLISNIMCAVVSFQYCDMLYGIEYKGYSAPAEIAFLNAIPFVFCIVLCLLVSLVFYRKSKSKTGD